MVIDECEKKEDRGVRRILRHKLLKDLRNCSQNGEESVSPITSSVLEGKKFYLQKIKSM